MIDKDRLKKLLKEIPKDFGTDGKTIKYRETPWGRKKEKDITTHRMNGAILAEILITFLKEIYSTEGGGGTVYTTPSDKQVWEAQGSIPDAWPASVEIPLSVIGGGIIQVNKNALDNENENTEMTINFGTPAIGTKIFFRGGGDAAYKIKFGNESFNGDTGPSYHLYDGATWHVLYEG